MQLSGWLAVHCACHINHLSCYVCPSSLTTRATTMQTYTLCDLDNKETHCYSDCRFENHAPRYESTRPQHHDYVTSADSADVAYYFRCPDYYGHAYADDTVSATGNDNWWETGCRVFYTTDNGCCFGGSWSDDVTQEDRGYLCPIYDGASGVECMEVLSVQQRQPTWSSNCEMVTLEDGQRTGSQCRAPTGTGNRSVRGVETFKWMTVRRGGASKCVHSTGASSV